MTEISFIIESMRWMQRSAWRATRITSILAVLAIVFPLSLAAQVTGSTNLTVTTGTGWKLVWSDEFNGPSLDTTKWEYREDYIGVNPPPLQSGYLTNRSVNVSVPGDGYLHLTALNDKYVDSSGTHPYTTGQIDSHGLEAITYGAVEIRAQLPDGDGVWPALWMMPVNSTYGGWPSSGEIDILEMPASDPTLYGSIHYGSTSSDATMVAYSLPSGNFSSGFHVFRLEWSPGEIKWLVDGNLYSDQTSWSTPGGPYPAPFDQPFYIILSQQLGNASGWSGPPDSSTPFPSTMLIDYVRIYQQN